MITTFSLHPTFRDTWGQFDAYAVDQLLPAVYEPCYRAKWYKAPEDNREVVPAGGYLQSEVAITPGSLIIGFYHNLTSGLGLAVSSGGGTGYLVQVTDISLAHKLQSDPVPDYVLGNYNGGMPNLLTAPHPVVGTGHFAVEFWNRTTAALRCQLVFGVLEVCECLQR